MPLTPEQKEAVILDVFRAIHKQEFYEWFGGRFDDYVTGEMQHQEKKSSAECGEIIRKELRDLIPFSN